MVKKASFSAEYKLFCKLLRDARAKAGLSQEDVAKRLTVDSPMCRNIKLLDQHFPAAKPEEFLIRYGEPGQVAPPMTPELQQFDTSARSWLNQAEFPATIGNSLITTIAKVAQQTQHLSADQLESYGLLQYERLERVYGAELEDKLNAAGHMVVEIDKKTPGLKNLLRSKGLGDNAEVAQLLIQQAERYWLRRKGR